MQFILSKNGRKQDIFGMKSEKQDIKKSEALTSDLSILSYVFIAYLLPSQSLYTNTLGLILYTIPAESCE